MGKFLLTVSWHWGGQLGEIWGEATALCLKAENNVVHPCFLTQRRDVQLCDHSSLQ